MKSRSSEPVMIILGAGVKRRGQLSDASEYRARKAIRMLKRQSFAAVVVSGGTTNRHGKTEAEVLQRFLLKHHISLPVILEKSSKETIGNAVFSKQVMMSKRGSSKVVVVTSAEHEKRTRHIFSWVFGDSFDITIVACVTKPDLAVRCKELVLRVFVKIAKVLASTGDHRAIQQRVLPLTGKY